MKRNETLIGLKGLNKKITYCVSLHYCSEKAEKALWFAETCGLTLKTLHMEDTTGRQINVNIGQATQSGKSTLTGNISKVYLAAETKLAVFIPYTANATSSSEGGQGNVTCTTAPCQEKMPSEYIACTSTTTTTTLYSLLYNLYTFKYGKRTKLTYNYWVWRLINWEVFELAPSYFKLPITKDGEQNCNKDNPHFENLLYFICSSKVLHFLLQASLSHHMKCLSWDRGKG